MECEVKYESYVNGPFELQVRPNDVYFIQYENFAGFFVNSTKDLADLVVLLKAAIEEHGIPTLIGENDG